MLIKLTIPRFWRQRKTISYLLLPISGLYYIAALLKKTCSSIFNASAQKPSFIRLCVGNVTVGGAGKTPLCIFLAEYLTQKHGLNLAFASRGYGGNYKSPLIVHDNSKYSFLEVGDEVLLLSKIAPVCVSRDRSYCQKMLNNKHIDLVIMDDGLQSTEFDFGILVIDGKTGIGNGFLIPAGMLREPVVECMKKINAVVIIGEDDHNLEQGLKHLSPAMPVFHANIVVNTNRSDQPVVAFAGIGNPDKFFSTLAAHGYKIAQQFSFPDHYKYQEKDILKLQEHATKLGATLITTEKDYVRIAPHFQEAINTLPITLQFNKEFEKFIDTSLIRLVKKTLHDQ